MDIKVACPQSLPQIDSGLRHQFEDAISATVFRHNSMRCELERRLAQALRLEYPEKSALRTPLSRFDDRVAIEPVLQCLWPKLMGHTQAVDIDRLLDVLLGESARRRQHPSTTHYAHDGTRSVFPPAEKAQVWLDIIDNVERSASDPLAMACFAYAQAVLSHPYADGNGRLARAMYQRSLGRSGQLSGPHLPLGPLVYANHRVHDRTLQHLGSTGDWNPFVEVMLGLTLKAAAFTRHTLSNEQFVP